MCLTLQHPCCYCGCKVTSIGFWLVAGLLTLIYAALFGLQIYFISEHGLHLGTDELANPVYEERKAVDLITRINEWITSNTKTIVYFPYASYAGDALRGVKSFAGKTFNRDKVALYTGRNLEEVSTAVLAERKRKAFDEFRSGEKPVMLATKAFGMGVDINNIVNVYHYAVTGNLCDYVQ